MIYEYKDLRNVIKVGDTVRAVPGKNNLCGNLKDDGSNEGKITDIDDKGFKINGCYHWYDSDAYLDLNPSSTPSWDTLKVGDVIVGTDGQEATVLTVLDKVFLLSSWGDSEQAGSWRHIKEAQNKGYTLKGAEEVEMTNAEKEAFNLLKNNGYTINKKR